MNRLSKSTSPCIWRWLHVLIATALIVIVFSPAQIAYAASITVTTTADTIDAAATCAAVTLASLPGPDGQTSLREAVCAANTNAGADTITFAVNGTFALTGAANEDNGGTGDLDIKQSLTINGNGASNTIIDGSGTERIFDVFPSAASTFELTSMTLQNGDTRSTTFKEGGAIYLHNNVTTTITGSRIVDNFAGANAAIENRGVLTINSSVISNNQTIPTSGSVTGGGIHNAGQLTINNTTISNNSVRGEGGGIFITLGSAVTANINNSTISGNSASVTGGGLGNGGGIATTGNQGAITIVNSTISGNHADNNGGGAYFVTPGGGTGNATLTNVTIANNTADNDNNGSGAGGGFAQNTAAVTLRNTIVAANFNSTVASRDDISGAVVAASSYNLIGDGTGATGITNGVNNNQVGSGASPVDPLLGSLANNGGSTETHSLLTGSPAINTANNATCPATDQRGIARPSGGTCDKGAYELSDTIPPDTTITADPDDPSNSSSATFTFSGSDTGGSGLAGFQCQIDGGGFTSCTSPQTYLGLADGSHTFQVRAIDGAGNVDPSPASFTWTIDTTPPNTSITADPGDPSNSSSASFQFSGSDTGGIGVASFECKLDSGSFAACTSPQDYTSLTDGSHTFQVRAIDNAGNVDASPASFTWTIDTAAPNTTITANPDDPTSSDSASFEFSGSDTGGSGVASFECKLDSGSFAACTNPQSYTGLSEGSHTFQVRAKDNADNVDASPASFTWTIDTIPPDTTITDNPDDPSNSSAASFEFSGSDSGGSGVASFECKLDSGAFTSCTSPQDYTGLADGSHTFQVRAIDNLGNVDASPASFTWTIDTTAPDTTITANPDDPTNSDSASFEFSGSDTGGSGVASFECKLDSGSFAACTNPQSYTGLSEGSHTFQVRAKDNADNVDASPASFTWTIDTIPPDTTITDNPDDPSNSSAASFEFSGSDSGGSGVASFECKLDSGAFTSCTSPQNYTGLADGSHTFQVQAIDNAGNVDTSPASFDWTIDATAPDTSIFDNPDDPSNSSAASFQFSGSDSGSGVASFECKLDSASFATCVSPQDYTGLTDGSHTFQVRAKDNLGNVDASPASFTWTIDTTPPDVTINQASGQADPTTETPIFFTVVFTEPVTGFGDSSTDVTLGGTAGATTATVTEIAPNDDTTYSVTVSGMTVDGTVTAAVPAGAANDAASNGNTASTSTDNTVTFIANQAPTADDDNYSTNEDTVLTVAAANSVLNGDNDPDGDALTVVLVDDVSSGELTLNADGSFVYTPTLNFTGSDSFTYRANDGGRNSNLATVTITVDSVEDAPTADNDSYSTNEDSVLTVASPGVLDGDNDPDGDGLTVVLVDDVAHGALDLDADGSFVYTPTLNFTGSDSFTYKVSDGGLESNVATVTLTVNPVQDAPTADNDSYTTDEDTVLTVASADGVLNGDDDPDGDALTVVLVDDVAHGVLDLHADGSFVYTPTLDFNGNDSFTYKVSDGGLESNVATVTLTVNPVNDAPTADNESYSTDEDTVLTIPPSGVLDGDSDVEGSALSSELVSYAGPGTLSFNADGSFVYTPTLNFNGSDSFTYRASDGDLESNIATVTLTVNPVEDAPTADDDSYTTNEDSVLTVPAPGVLDGDSDPDGDALTVVLVDGVGSGELTLNADGSFVYTPTLDFNGSDSFTYKASDGGLESNIATVTLTVNPVNDAPTADNDSYSTNEDSVLTVASADGVLNGDDDLDGDGLSVVLVDDVDSGELTLNADGSFVYTPTLDFNGSDSFTYRASDGDLESDIATVTLTVDSVNDAPTADADSYTTDEETTLTVPAPGVLDGDSDVEGSALSSELVSYAGPGALSFNADGSFVYTPTLNFTGSDSFTYRASDGDLESAIATVTLTVNPVEDAPTADDDSYTTNEDTVLTVASADGVLNGDDDPDGDGLTVVLVDDVAHGVLDLDADGSFVYTPTLNFNGSDSFTYNVSDGGLESNIATVTLTVNPVNDAPEADDDSYTTNEDSALTVAAADGVLDGDDDLEGDALTVVLVDDVAHGVLDLNTDGSFVYTPTLNFNGSDSFTYRASDGDLDSDITTVTITVNPVEDAPTADYDSYSTNEDSVLTVAAADGVLDGDSDPDGDALTVVLVDGVGSGELTLNADGSYIYTPTLNFNGSDSFTYKVSDGGLESNIATVTITVDSVNDAPQASVTGGQIVAVESLVSLDGTASSDADGDLPLVFAWVQTGGPAVSFSPSLSLTTFTAPSTPTVLTFTLTVTDSAGLASTPASTVVNVFDVGITALAATNDSPTVLDEATTFEATLATGSNVDYTWDFGDGASDNGATPSHTYAAVGEYTATVTATNSASSQSTTTTVTVVDTEITELVASNDGPTVLPSVTNFTASATGSNIDYEWAFGDGSSGVGATPSHAYAAAGNYTAIVTASNGSDIKTATTPVIVNAEIFLPPVATNDAVATVEGSAVEGNVLNNDHDPQASPLTVSGFDQPAHGTVAVAADGDFTYTPGGGFTGVDSFDYTVSNEHGLTATAQVFVVVESSAITDKQPTVVLVTPGVTTTHVITTENLGISLQVPADAYSGTLDTDEIFFMVFTVVVTPTEHIDDAPGTFHFAGVSFILTPYLNDDEREHYRFPTPLILELTYPASVLEDLDPDTLTLFYWDSEGESWGSDGIQVVAHDVENRKITFAISHLTEFAMFAQPLDTTDEEEIPQPEDKKKIFMPSLSNE